MGFYTYNIRRRLMTQSTVDTTPVVRCKDCKYNWNTPLNYGKNHPKCNFTDYALTENDFCSRGEKINNETY